MPSESDHEAKVERRNGILAALFVLAGMCIMWQGTWIYGAIRWGWGC